MLKESDKTSYDKEPVTYCAKCYSLNIKYEETYDLECCGDCGCSDTVTSSLEEWEALYQKRYGHKLIEKKEGDRKAILDIPLPKLKTIVYRHPNYLSIIKHMYPNFPPGYPKIEAVLLFFDRLIKDGRLNDLRYILINNKF